MANKLTTIELPHAALRYVGKILEDAGFTLGTTGCGCGTMERDGAITKKEEKQLRAKMAEALFEFDVDDIYEEDESD